MKDFLEDCLFYLLAIPLVFGMCALYWLCRICGVEVDE